MELRHSRYWTPTQVADLTVEELKSSYSKHCIEALELFADLQQMMSILMQEKNCGQR